MMRTGGLLEIFYLNLLQDFLHLLPSFQRIFDNILNRTIPWPSIPIEMFHEAQDLIDRLNHIPLSGELTGTISLFKRLEMQIFFAFAPLG